MKENREESGILYVGDEKTKLKVGAFRKDRNGEVWKNEKKEGKRKSQEYYKQMKR